MYICSAYSMCSISALSSRCVLHRLQLAFICPLLGRNENGFKVERFLHSVQAGTPAFTMLFADKCKM